MWLVSEPANSDKVVSPFGGCNLLLSQYKSIGTELSRFEEIGGQYGYRSEVAYRGFRQGVAFIPNEVLESYLEDLLDLNVSEEKLNVGFFRPRLIPIIISLCGLIFAVLLGLNAASMGISTGPSFALTVLVGVPFAFLWHRCPKSRLARRMGFAKLLSREISRRRGIDSSTGLGPGLKVVEGFLGKTKEEVFPGAALEVIKEPIH